MVFYNRLPVRGETRTPNYDALLVTSLVHFIQLLLLIPSMSTCTSYRRSFPLPLPLFTPPLSMMSDTGFGILQRAIFHWWIDHCKYTDQMKHREKSHKWEMVKVAKCHWFLFLLSPATISTWSVTLDSHGIVFCVEYTCVTLKDVLKTQIYSVSKSSFRFYSFKHFSVPKWNREWVKNNSPSDILGKMNSLMQKSSQVKSCRAKMCVLLPCKSTSLV